MKNFLLYVLVIFASICLAPAVGVLIAVTWWFIARCWPTSTSPFTLPVLDYAFVILERAVTLTIRFLVGVICWVLARLTARIMPASKRINPMEHPSRV